MRLWTLTLGFTLIAGGASAHEQDRLVSFPDMFVATWGDSGGPNCAQYPGRTVITSTSIRYREWRANAGDASQLADNQLLVRFLGDSPATRANMRVTVGTTGSRLFIERSGRVVATLTMCEP